jgi:chondroitin sulfate proteoglycan 4
MPLNVFPLTRKLISDKLLLTTCSDEAREIRYIVRNGPHLGKVIMETSEGVWLEVERFTQRDINNSKVIYEHTKQFMDLTANDSFTFDVETHFAGTLTSQVWNMTGSSKFVIRVTAYLKFLQCGRNICIR